MGIKFKIVIPSYNCADWLPDCLQSLEDQTYKNYDPILINDASTDERQSEIIERYAQRNGWLSLHHQEHRGAMANIVQGIRLMQCAPNDVVFVLDGDDWLYNDEVLHKLSMIYAKEDVDLTYGKHVRYPTLSLGEYSKPLTEEMVSQRSYRRLFWRFSQLRTFKHFLWQAIRDEDLRDAQGHYVPACYDYALMFPMMEMVGRRFKAVDDILYVYNVANPINDSKVHKRQQKEMGNYLRQKPKYDVLGRS